MSGDELGICRLLSILLFCSVFQLLTCTRTLAENHPAQQPDRQEKLESSLSDSTKFVDLLAEDFSKTWKTFSSETATAETAVWSIVQPASAEERVLTCTGTPRGFAFTSEKYRNFELSLEWMYPQDANGNSGVLIYTQSEPRIWPTSIQVQLHQPKAGSIFPSGDAKSASTLEAAPDLARPVAMWNECRINSMEGRISVEINGKKAGEISGAAPAYGHIALQSEGSAVHFRRIRIRDLSPVDPAPKPAPGSNAPPSDSPQ